MRQIPAIAHPDLLVGSATADDAGVLRLDATRALVLTVDFFTPIVDDPFTYGEIAAANSLSDVYAMGGRPLAALNLLGVPADVLPPKIINAIVRGGASKVHEAKCILIGGHTIRNPEPIYGLAVTGLVSPGRMMTNAAAKPGDWLVLTKPLGTGIITTGIKRRLASKKLAQKAIDSMRALNTAGATLAEAGLTRAGTDITGYGFLGHLGSMCKASGVGAEIDASAIPVLDPGVFELISQDCVPGGSRENLKNSKSFARWKKVAIEQQLLLADAQTSGGLLLCIPRRKLDLALKTLAREKTLCASVVGRITNSAQRKIEVHSHLL